MQQCHLTSDVRTWNEKTGGRVDKFITTVTVHTATRWHHCLIRVSLSERQQSACVTAAIAIVNINNIDGRKGAAVFADKLSAAVDSDLGTMTNIFGSKHSLN